MTHQSGSHQFVPPVIYSVNKFRTVSDQMMRSFLQNVNRVGVSRSESADGCKFGMVGGFQVVEDFVGNNEDFEEDMMGDGDPVEVNYEGGG